MNNENPNGVDNGVNGITLGNNINMTDINPNPQVDPINNQTGYDVNSLNNVETLGDIDVVQPQIVEQPAPQQVQTDGQQIDVMPNPQVVSEPTINTTPEQPTQTPSFIKPVENTNQNTNDLLNSVPKPDIMISSPANNSVSTDDLLEEYVGKNFSKLSKRKFNLAAFFLNGTYMIYRKMLIEGILVYIILLVAMYALLLINPFISLIVSLLISIILCFAFNKIYISSTRKKIEAIKNKNKNKSVADLKQICRKKGGTSLILAIFVPAIISAAVTIIFNQFFPFGINDILEKISFPMNNGTNTNSNNSNTEENNNNNNDQKKSIEDVTYNEDIILSDLLEMGYLQVFTATELNTEYAYDYKKQTVADNENSYIAFNLSVVNDYDSSVEFINEMANYYNASDTVTTTTTNNGYTWNTFTEEGEKNTTYSAIDEGDYVFVFKYEIDSEASSVASVYYKGILNSINFKE